MEWNEKWYSCRLENEYRKETGAVLFRSFMRKGQSAWPFYRLKFWIATKIFSMQSKPRKHMNTRYWYQDAFLTSAAKK
jgi:hypothetical protein